MQNKLLSALMVSILVVTLSVSAEKPAFAQGEKETQTTSAQNIASVSGTATAALTPGLGAQARVVAVPTPLSTSDALHYAKAFQYEAQGQWGQATREMAQVTDPLLKGHLLARHYLSAPSHPVIEELRSWMADYYDLPQAEDIYRMATEKAGHSSAEQLKTPIRGALKDSGADISDDGANWEELSFKDDANTPLGQSFKVKLRAAFRGKHPEQAQAILREAYLKDVDQSDQDVLKMMAAMHHFTSGRPQDTLSLASDVAERSGDDHPAAYWLAGLSEWRLGHAEKARHYFEHLAETPDSNAWMMAAGAFWAARSNLVAHHPELVNHWLEIAATYPRTFYGLLARRILGYETLFSWTTVPFTEADAEILLRVPGGRRALALLQVGQRQAAEDEIRRAYPRAGKSLRQSMLALAQGSDMAELALRLGGMSPGQSNDTVAYPLPQWTPHGGWALDKALIFAFIRQESRFKPNAKSARGAGGLMQIMPATAAALAGSRAREQLNDPQYNLDLGQRYIAKLMAADPVNGNLIYLAASYNAGPGKVAAWIAGFERSDDPLLFIESMPSRETRTFVERIMTNYWIYRGRLGLTAPSLDQIATGQWPTYDGSNTVAQVRTVSKK